MLAHAMRTLLRPIRRRARKLTVATVRPHSCTPPACPRPPARRRASLFANTSFTGAAYHPDDSQIVTVGTDRKARARARRRRGRRRRSRKGCCSEQTGRTSRSRAAG